MKLRDFIIQQLEAMQKMLVKEMEFTVFLDGKGQVVSSGMTCVRFTLTNSK
jgi:hypothetical protein